MSEEDALRHKEELAQRADALGFTGDKKAAYIYGGLRRMGWQPKREQHATVKQ